MIIDLKINGLNPKAGPIPCSAASCGELNPKKD
jgi:hypothetical protein